MLYAPPHTNRPRKRRHRHAQHPPASPWNAGFIHWYIHRFMLCLRQVTSHEHPGAALFVPHCQHEFRHHAQKPGTKPLDQILWDL